MKGRPLEEIIGADPGIDFLNYSLEGEIEKYKGIEPRAWNLLIRIYVPTKQNTDLKRTESGLYLPPTKSHELDYLLGKEDRFTALTGLVIKVAPAVYQDINRYELSGPYCKVGDWVMISRASGHTFAHNNCTSIWLKEDAIDGIISDPRTITRVK